MTKVKVDQNLKNYMDVLESITLLLKIYHKEIVYNEVSALKNYWCVFKKLKT